MQSLRGESAKQKFIKEYRDVKVLVYAVLLNGDKKPNQCGGELTDKYYQFSAIHKNTGRKEIFYLGYDCGQQLLKLLNIPVDSIKLFNPFKQTIDDGLSVANDKSSSMPKDRQIQPTTLANELFEIISIMYLGLNLSDTHILDDIIMKLRENIGENPSASNFASVNTILNKYGTISGILERLQKNNKPFKTFDFLQSRAYLKEYLKKKNMENEKINF
ncbi:hypothetical protein [Helicobacter sp.]|uniref:hypothetical protein n=1 Tax=Helicobacter sp. TaxID=218 RepID=UPI0025C6727C|nr:hypothetical protein [Helicobacter sp.]MCI5968720.1 hypothetical protein [Helicobacter sp.]MDY2584543.1 hypothetical protein [Helicobacter sp.]